MTAVKLQGDILPFLQFQEKESGSNLQFSLVALVVVVAAAASVGPSYFVQTQTTKNYERAHCLDPLD